MGFKTTIFMEPLNNNSIPSIFCHLSPTSSRLYPLQVENCDSTSRLVGDEDDDGKYRLERANAGPPSAMVG